MPASRTVTVAGMDQLARKLDQLAPQILAGLREAVKAETEEIADDMRRHAPRKTGALVDSIQAEISPDGFGGTAAVTIWYGKFVEHGTSDTPQQPFATPAAARARRRFSRRVREAVGGRLKDMVQ